MRLTFIILAILLLVIATASAVVDFRGSEKVEELMRRLGHRPKFEHLLGIIKLAGALGLVIGLVAGVTALAIAAALGFTVYFALAVRAHRSIGDPASESIPAIVLLLLSAATAVTGLLG